MKMAKNQTNSHKSAAMLLCMSVEELDKLLEIKKELQMMEHDQQIRRNIYESNLADLEALLEAGEKMYQLLKTINNEKTQEACEHWRNCRL
ncbi:MAG: hypothetical protein EB127_05950 [Alphaproteobacteria bacterium]|jgi:hypothetical protein|nr:hypothetical protein [Alphaproteobacteria bacterium]